jgi:hypothetical protein
MARIFHEAVVEDSGVLGRPVGMKLQFFLAAVALAVVALALFGWAAQVLRRPAAGSRWHDPA